jgi:hypothetical protein
MSSDPMVVAVNRLADSQFEQAKALRRTAKAAERGVAVSEQMLEMQSANLAVTALLEARLTEQNDA